MGNAPHFEAEAIKEEAMHADLVQESQKTVYHR
jgi:hypothetical protein